MSSEPGTGATQEPAAPAQAEEASAVAVASDSAPAAEPSTTDETQRPRVRLNPSVDPNQLKARPSIDASEAQASPDPSSAAVPPEQALYDAAKAEVTMQSLPPGPPAKA